MFRILHIPLHYKPICTAMYSVYTMLLRIEWQFGIYMTNWYMSNVYSKYSKRIGGGSFPVAFSDKRVYT